MTIGMQIALGSLILGICSAIHIGILAIGVEILRRVGRRLLTPHKTGHWVLLTALAFIAVVLAHTIQVWVWAISFVALSIVQDFSEAIYFSLVTYTTLGYGDIIAGDDSRVFAAMAAVTGLLNFGLSTAFLVGFLAKLLPRDFR